LTKIKIIKSEKIRYLCVGTFNTVFGYLTSVYLYILTVDKIGVIGVAIVSNIISITLSFITYKIFVFRTKGNWIIEYVKAYIVYGFGSVLGIIIVVLMVNGLKFQFWIAQGIAILMVTVLSYISHSKFTFMKSN